MRITLLFVFLSSFLFTSAKEDGRVQDSLINSEIRYSNKYATEVYLVWGINDWQKQVQSLQPVGTYIKGNLMYTPMEIKDGVFSVKLKVKKNTIVDYVFWITKGPMKLSADTWDNNGGETDYHIHALNDNITLTESKLEIKGNKLLSLLDFSWPFLLVVTILLFVVLAFKKFRYQDLLASYKPINMISSAALSLIVILAILRLSVLKISWDVYLHPESYISKLIFAGFYDYLYVVILSLIFFSFLLIFRKRKRAQYILVSFFVLIGIITLLAGILNIKVVEMLDKPFNYRWLYYSDFLRSSDAKSALSQNIESGYITSVIAICTGFILLGMFFISFIQLVLGNIKLKKVWITVFLLGNLSYVLYADKKVKNSEWSYDKLANPVAEFLSSMNPFTKDPVLFTMKIPDSLKFNPENEDSHNEGAIVEKGTIKNVIFFVLESTAAEYIQPYDSLYRITPELENNLSNAVVFENIYAHAPATNKSMVSLLSSIYPWLSYASITQEHPGIKLPTISSELSKIGYRTAFFNSGDNHFQKAGEFLQNRSFDVIMDCKKIYCDNAFKDKDKEFAMDGLDDECTETELINWITSDYSKPFFGMLWTYQTHYPYYVSGEANQYNSSDETLNRYLNAVNHSDKVLGKLIEELKQYGLFESTLIVVIGDHGEAFGRHNQITHASKIYEENLHIPCVFINPAFGQRRVANLGGVSDIAPTVMNILGYKSPDEWQGQDLFTSAKDKRVYFFCPWSDHLFGFREGDRKYIYNATTDATEIYDLKKDPHETFNIATESDENDLYQLRLAAWVQYQNKFMEEAIKKR